MADNDWAERVRGVLKKSLQSLDMATPVLEVDAHFHGLCHDVALAKGYMADGWLSLAPYLDFGIAMCQPAFAHLDSMDARVWLALFTAFGGCLDDTYLLVEDTVISSFALRLTSGQRQLHPDLDRFAAHLRELPQHMDETRSGLGLVSIFNWITSLHIDRFMSDKEIPRASGRFAAWYGLLSGANELYAMFAFPPEIPFHILAPAIPDMMVVIRNNNDVFSFYKEERAGEKATQVCILADTTGLTKLDALDTVARVAVDAHESICDALREHPAARTAWLAFARGYVEFHFAAKRYRLDELGVDREVILD
ncbi:terpenoid synthase [Auricularia subglabra TFB-10046 SS5]|nr:terpenoid synthase [Auricularia subglabra TFB-10046 SS5]